MPARLDTTLNALLRLACIAVIGACGVAVALGRAPWYMAGIIVAALVGERMARHGPGFITIVVVPKDTTALGETTEGPGRDQTAA